MVSAADYRPVWWARSGHVQSLLGSNPWRQRLGERCLAATGARTSEYLIDAGDGVRLLGLHSVVPGRASRGLALLLHGWEGSVESSYMRLTAAHLLEAGFEVFRLNFRDHGGTHHLNEGIFHSNRIDEVVRAAAEVARHFPARPMVAAGYSLGGNFTLRLALRAHAAGVPLQRVAVVCPVLDPARTMAVMEQGLPVYRWYFQRKWTASLARKRALFPHLHDFGDHVLRMDMRTLTGWLVERQTEFGSLEHYFDGYCITGDRLAALPVPARILMAADDPVIPVADFHRLQLPASARLEISPWGGHCGFVEGARLEGFAERWITAQLAAPGLGAD
jgi:predicted alpha/beta-fold hydrolase